MRAEERQRRRFSEVIAQGVADPRLYMLMSMRTDFLGELQKDEPLYKVHRQIDVPPLREAELREVVSRPAELLSARFETAGLADIITRRTAEDSVKDVGALPLLSYTLDDMWTQMVKRGDGVLRLPAQSFELGGVLVDRADAFLAAHPKSQDELRRIFTLKLATVREGEEPTRRRALRSEFYGRGMAAGLRTRRSSEPPSRHGDTRGRARPMPRWRTRRSSGDGASCATGLLPSASFSPGELGSKRLAAPGRQRPTVRRSDALLMGAALTQAQSWLAKRREDLPVVDRDFIDQSAKRESKARAGARGACRPSFTCCWPASSLGLIGWINQAYLKEQWNWYTTVRPYMVVQVRPVCAQLRGRAGAEAAEMLSGNAPRTVPRWSSCLRGNS